MTRAACLSAPICALSVLPVLAQVETVSCRLASSCLGAGCAEAPVVLEFAIDHMQFTPPVLRRDPPKRKVTSVIAGDMQFRAEPFLMDSGMRGFWGVVNGVDHLLTVKPDGAALYTVTPPGRLYSGTCEVAQ